MPISIGVNIKLPKKLFKDMGVDKALEDGLNKYSGPAMVKLFEQTVEGWDTKPDFKATVTSSSRNLILRVVPFGRGKSQYTLVSLGSPSHTIQPKKKGYLSFKQGYIPSTRPGSLMSGKNKKFGGYVSTQIVHHPGFEARDFDVLVAREYDRDFHEDMQRSVDEAVKDFSV